MTKKEQKKIEALKQAKAYMQHCLPQGEQLIGFLDGYKQSASLYFLFGIFSLLVGDNFRKYGIGFSDKSIIFVGYTRNNNNYEPVHFWCRPISEVKTIHRTNIYGKIGVYEITSKNYLDKKNNFRLQPKKQRRTNN